MASPLKVKNLKIARQAGADGTLYATWSFSNKHVDSYDLKWYYTTGDTHQTKTAQKDSKGKVKRYKSGKNKGKIIYDYKTVDTWFEGSRTTVKIQQATYSIPSNAIKVNINVKPIAKTYTSGSGKNKKEVPYFTGGWSGPKAITVRKTNNPPATPPSPTVTVKGTKLTTYIDNYVVTTGTATKIEFEVIENDSNCIAKKTNAAINRGHASYTCTVSAGKRYKVRARAVAGKLYGNSGWTDYTSNEYTVPAAVTGVPSAKLYSQDSIKISWDKTSGVTGYEIEYTDDYNKFDVSEDVQSSRRESTSCTRIISGLAAGTKWYFRVRAFNDAGDGPWRYNEKKTKVKGKPKIIRTPVYGAITVGTAPSAPTTWSYSSIISPDDPFRLNWTHNSEDGSEQTARKVSTHIVRGTESFDKEYQNNTKNQYIILNNSTYATDPTPLQDGDIITWKVQTKGIYDAWSPWSGDRTIRVYAKPTLSVSVEQGEEVTTYPIKLSFSAGPSGQKIVSMYVAIVATEPYRTDLPNGEEQIVVSGDEVFSRTIYNPETNDVTLELTPGDVHLENGYRYSVQATVGMDSGLTAESPEYTFRAVFSGDPYAPYADIYVDPDTLAASITPYCIDEDYIPVNGNGTLSVYRREYDGTFTPVALNLDMTERTTVVDPHPALDFARYRIVARDAVTGHIYYTDMPGVPTGETSIVIQWDEEWRFFDADDNTMDSISWTGSMLRLDYNIDVSDTFDQDAALVAYIGREYPVSYYGTQKGHTSSWKVEIPKTDTETLYSIRRLARYAGDCYIREPSGSGYWAQVDVSYSITHAKPTIPVTFSITHVDGPAPVDQEILEMTEEETEDTDA